MKHPSIKQLQTYASDGGSTEFRMAVGRHLERCSECLRNLDKSAANPACESANLGFVVDKRAADPDTLEQLKNHRVYEIVELLGSGGMGMVYRVRHKLTGRDEVLKVISPELVARTEVRARFLKEIQAAAKLDHANIVRTLTAFEDDNLLGLVMEYAPGKDLDVLLRERGPLPYRAACKYIVDACRGLQYAMEQGMVHRDIKPANLLLVGSKGEQHIKILDFGLSKGVGVLEQTDTSLTMDGRITDG